MLKPNPNSKQYEVNIASTPQFSIHYHKGVGLFSTHYTYPKNQPIALFLIVRGKSVFIKTGISSPAVPMHTNRCQLFFDEGMNPKISCKSDERWAFFEIRLASSYINELPSSVSSVWDLFINKVKKRKPALLSTADICYTTVLKEVTQSFLSAQFTEPSLQEKYYEAKIREMLLHIMQELLLPSENKPRIPNKHQALVTKAKQVLDRAKAGKDFTIVSIAESLGTNETTLKQAFKKVTGIPIYQYYLDKQMLFAQKLLDEGYSITEVAGKVGYSAVGHFSHQFKKKFGSSPKNFR